MIHIVGLTGAGWRRKFRLALLVLACQFSTVHATEISIGQTAELIDYDNVSERSVAIADVSNPTVPGKTFIAATVIGSSIEKLCSTITNYPEYPKFMPNMEKTSIVSSSDESTVIEMILKLPLGKIKRYRLKMESVIAPLSCYVSWKLLPWEDLQQSETITDTSGYWQFTPDPKDSSKTLVKYYVFADPGPIPYGLGWIVGILTKVSLPRTLEALRERVAVK
ncbi:hypothetical protein AAKU58_000478 [Oxalobacteraceae bacterium GrIS 1.18]